jgi:hypothetical protein
MAFTIKDNDFSEDVRKLVLTKQVELKAKKKNKVSVGKTIEILLKDAYLKKEEKR